MLSLELFENIFLFLREKDIVSFSLTCHDLLYISLEKSNYKVYRKLLFGICRRDLDKNLAFLIQKRKLYDVHNLIFFCIDFNCMKCFEYLIRTNIDILKYDSIFVRLFKKDLKFILKLLKDDLINGNICDNYFLKQSKMLSDEEFTFVLSKTKLCYDTISLFYSDKSERFKIVLYHENFNKRVIKNWISAMFEPGFHQRLNRNLLRKEIIDIWLDHPETMKIINENYTKKYIYNFLKGANKVVKEAFWKIGYTNQIIF